LHQQQYHPKQNMACQPVLFIKINYPFGNVHLITSIQFLQLELKIVDEQAKPPPEYAVIALKQCLSHLNACMAIIYHPLPPVNFLW
jgi:hypothetical protein